MNVLAAWSAGPGLGFLVALPLGPIGLLCVRSVPRNGFPSGFAIGLGAACVDVLHAGPGLAGVGRLLDVRVLRTALGIAGAVAMACPGLRSLRSAFGVGGAVETEGETVPPSAAFRTAPTATAANPATIGYWAAAFAAATAADVTGTFATSPGMLVGVGCGTLLWFTALSVAVMLFRRWFTSRMLRGVDLFAGVGVILFGGVLAHQAVG